MKIVCDISEEDYNNIEPFLNGETINGGFNLFKVLDMIRNSTPLPEHHEDCISREAVIKHLENITMDTNPDHYDSKDNWYQANGFNACKVDIEMYVADLPSVTPKAESEE